MADDFYARLGLPPTATAAEIKAAYRKLAKQHHPDMGGSADKLASINEAADVLSDPAKRESYDRERRMAPKSQSGAGSTSGASGKNPASPTPTADNPPPRKPTVALCEHCGRINRVDGDPRFYPANCGQCHQPLGSKPPEPSTRYEPPADMATARPVAVRCPHCQQKNQVPAANIHLPVTCIGCSRSFTPTELEGEDSLGSILSDLGGKLFKDPLGAATDTLRSAERKLKEMADELKKREP